MYYQQGDILIRKIDALPAAAEKKHSPKGRLVLAEGEATGHAHAIEDTEKVQLYTLDEILLLVADSETTIVHEEHRSITLPPGVYQIGKVREWDYTQHEAREVVD